MVVRAMNELFELELLAMLLRDRATLGTIDARTTGEFPRYIRCPVVSPED